MSRVTAGLSPLWLSASSSACHGLLIITVITPLYHKAQRDKSVELKLANAAITDMQMRQRDVAAPDAKYTKELADAALKMMLCVMMLPLVVVGCTLRSLSVSAEATIASGVDNAASTGRHR